jgi:hypothetical protein
LTDRRAFHPTIVTDQIATRLYLAERFDSGASGAKALREFLAGLEREQ